MIRRYLVIVLLVAVAIVTIAASASALTVHLTIYPGENWISIPNAPYNPDPLAVFAGIPIEGNLSRFDSPSQEPIVYSTATRNQFGGLLLGDGFVLNYTGSTPTTITYDGASDGLGDPNGMSDMWIGLPVGIPGTGGMNWIGQPFNHATSFNSLLVTNGYETIGINEAVQRNWIDGLWSTMNNETKQINTVGLSTLNSDDAYLRPGKMYKFHTYLNNTALIVPAYPVPEPTSIICLLSGLAGISVMVRRKR
jgi:hypothetical protein